MRFLVLGLVFSFSAWLVASCRGAEDALIPAEQLANPDGHVFEVGETKTGSDPTCPEGTLAVHGTRFGFEGNKEVVIAGCRDANAQRCDAAKLCGIVNSGAQSTCFFFTSTCVPSGFQEIGCVDPRCPKSPGETPPEQRIDVPPPAELSCDEILRARPAGEPLACNGSCTIAKAHPTLIAAFVMGLDEVGRAASGQRFRFTAQQAAQAQACMIEALQEAGISGPVGVNAGVEGRASFAQLKPFLDLWLTVSLRFSEPRCEDFSLEECTGNPFCGVKQGNVIDEARACILTKSQAAGCLSGGAICSAAFTYPRGPDGRCWEFASGCLPKGFSLVPNSGCPSMYGMPDCP